MLDFIGKWKDKITGYIDMRLQLIKLDIAGRVSNVLSYTIFIILCIVFLLPFLLFSGMGLAELISDLVQSRAGGFAITSGIYLLIMLLLLVFRKRIINAFAGMFIGVMTDGDDETPGEPNQHKQ